MDRVLKKGKLIIYSSDLFQESPLDHLETGWFVQRRFVAAGPAGALGPWHWEESLKKMRTTMLDDTDPVAGIFVGGDLEVGAEWKLMQERQSRPMLFAVGAPGGRARQFVKEGTLLDLSLEYSQDYPQLAWRIAARIAELDPRVGMTV
jgi:hypothetical protein